MESITVRFPANLTECFVLFIISKLNIRNVESRLFRYLECKQKHTIYWEIDIPIQTIKNLFLQI